MCRVSKEPMQIKDIAWRTDLAAVRDEAQRRRRPIILKPLNQGGAGPFW